MIQKQLKLIKLNKTKFLGTAILALVLLAVVVVAGCSSVVAGSDGTDPAVRTNSGGSVNIEVKNLGISGNSLSFTVAMDTHSVNLDQYDLKQLATLRDYQGNEYQPSFWDSAAGGHHRTGKLTFDQINSQIKPRTFELAIRNVAGIQERVFKW